MVLGWWFYTTPRASPNWVNNRNWLSDRPLGEWHGVTTVNFIALDGSVSLSLGVADATVDATTGTLSWTVESQPWQSGDKLMPADSGGMTEWVSRQSGCRWPHLSIQSLRRRL